MPRDQVSIRDVAERAGVSLGTVSNVLNRPTLVAEPKRLRVQQAIDELGFVRNDAARQLKAGQSDCIGFLLLDVRNPFFTDVARGVEQQAARHGLSVLLANSGDAPGGETAYLDLFARQRVRGVLVSPVGDVFERLRRLRRHGIVPVLVDRVSDGRPYASVSVDDVQGGYLAVTHLVEQGCRRLLFLGGPTRVRQVADRLAGARRAAAEHSGVTLEVLLNPLLTIETGAASASAIARRRPEDRPDGVFCANDLLAVGALHSLTMVERLDVPGDIALVGYDDIDFAKVTVVPLSSVRQPSLLLGRTAVDLLMEQVEAADGFRPRSVVFAPELVVRASSRRR